MAPTAQAMVVKIAGDGPATLEKRDLPIPEPGDNQVLVKVSHVAQNPTDVQSLDGKAFPDGSVLGCDFAGTVEKLGPKATRFAKGATVAGLIWGGEKKGLGGYSQYTLADEDILFEVPEGTSPASASTIPLAALTAEMALFGKDSLNIDKSTKNEPILVWGGSSSVGLFAVQIAALHGLEVITTCSAKHHALMRSLGAKHVFDYRDADVVDKIRAAAPGLRYVFDNIGNETSSATASQAIAASGGTLCTVRPGKAFTENVSKQTKVVDVLVFTAFLWEHKYKTTVYPTSQSDHDLAAAFCRETPKLLKSGRLRPNEVKLFKGGLDDIEKGFQEYRDQVISNYKIVYEL